MIDFCLFLRRRNIKTLQNRAKHSKIIERMFLKLIFLINLVIILSFNLLFSQTNELKKSPITGTWIEKGKGVDTIAFLPEYDGRNPIFQLKRGFRITEGHKLPDYYSGPYSYKLFSDSISLFWFASSGSFQTYFFKMSAERNEFIIDNFFKDPENKKPECDTLTFMRLQ